MSCIIFLNTALLFFANAPYFGTKDLYLCIINLKKEVNMWFAVIVSVSLAVEVLSYISGGEINININNRDAA